MIEVRPEVKKAIDSRIHIFTLLGPTMKGNLDRFLAFLEEAKTEEEIIHSLINIYPSRFESTAYPSRKDLDRVVKDQRIIIGEKFRCAHVATDENGDGAIPSKTFVSFPLTVRRNQQIIFKEAKSAKSADLRNVAGQVRDEDRSGAFTDSEISVAIGHNANAIQKELLGFGSSDLMAKKKSKEQIAETGVIKLNELPEDARNKKANWYLHHKMRVMGFDTDIISQPLK